MLFNFVIPLPCGKVILEEWEIHMNVIDSSEGRSSLLTAWVVLTQMRLFSLHCWHTDNTSREETSSPSSSLNLWLSLSLELAFILEEFTWR